MEQRPSPGRVNQQKVSQIDHFNNYSQAEIECHADH